MDGAFFETQQEQSLIKSLIVAKYFKAWSDVVVPWAGEKVAYVDLFSGPGRYDDGSPSTPLLVLQQAIENPVLCSKLVMHFNDVDPLAIDKLRSELTAVPGFESLRYPPILSSIAVGDELASVYSGLRLVPSLFFIDPFGYKGLSLKLIGNAIQSWGCDCIFFFNYNEVNRAIPMSGVAPLIEDLFGKERTLELRDRIAGMDSEARELHVVGELANAVKEVGGRYVLPFRFESHHSERPSHYIMFVSKHPRGYFIMKDVMYRLSSEEAEVKRFGWVPIRTKQLKLVLDFDHPYSISALKKLLVRFCSGRILTVNQVYEGYTIDTPYVLKNVQQAIQELEAEGVVTVDVPANKRPKKNGKVTLGKTRLVTFPVWRE